MNTFLYRLFHPWGDPNARVIQLLGEIMNNLDDLLIEVNDQTTRLDSLDKYVAGLEEAVKAALAGVNLSPENQAKLDKVFAVQQLNKKIIDNALNANVPPSPASTPPSDAPGAVDAPDETPAARAARLERERLARANDARLEAERVERERINREGL